MDEHEKQALVVNGLSFGYTKANVWEDVSLSLPEGTLAFLTGENGSGKSTLLRCLAGWSLPRSGTIELCGQPFNGTSRELRSRICFVPDAPSFYEDLTAFEHIQFLHKVNHRSDRMERAEQLMEDFGLAPFGGQFPSSFSRGMREKLGLIIALSLEPAVLLLDEPYGPLDRNSSERLSLELKAALARGAAVVLSCHHEVPDLEPDKTMHLHEGSLQCTEGESPRDGRTKAADPDRRRVLDDASYADVPNQEIPTEEHPDAL